MDKNREKNKKGRYDMNNMFPGFSIDCVILSFYKRKIRVLLREFEADNYWALLGGFMFNDEDADQAAYRTLETYTGSRNIFLQQFRLFSDPERTSMVKDLTREGEKMVSDERWMWIFKRFISLGYFALVKYDKVSLPTDSEMKLKWFDIQNLPELYADHKHIINTAITTIRAMLPVIPIGYELLPERFTMTELRKIYEIILGKTYDRRNFQRKVLSERIVIQLEEKRGMSQYNASSLYSFDKSKLNSLQKEDTGLIL